MLGKLNGAIEATTPTGYRSVRHSTPLLTSSTSPVVICGREQANSVSSIALATSASASPRVFPCSSLINPASCSRCRSSRARYRKNTCTRSLIGVPAQAGNAEAAELTAVSKSAADESGTRARRLPSLGFVTSRNAPFPSTNLPSMKFRAFGYLGDSKPGEMVDVEVMRGPGNGDEAEI